MSSEMLQKTRKINKTLQTSGGSAVSFDLLAGAIRRSFKLKCIRIKF